MLKQRTPEQKSRDARQRVRVYSIFAGVVAAAWTYQPYEYDVIPRGSPDGNYQASAEEVNLFSPTNRVLVITAHPDDSELMIGGTLTKLARCGAEIHQVICTDGDKGYYIFTDAKANRITRRKEANAAMREWRGRSLTFLGYSDGRLRSDKKLSDELIGLIQRIQPTHILCFDGPCPSRSTHGDHRYSGEAAEVAAARCPSVKWMLRFQTNGQNYAVDIADVWDEKVRLLKVHESQFSGKKLDGIVGLAEYMAERAAEKTDGGLAEGFRCSKPHGG